MPKTKLTITHKVGLHARPAAMFVKTASNFPCDIQVRNTTNNAGPANAKSILSILTLGVTQDHEIEIETNGDQSDEALAALTKLVENNFGE